MPAALDIADYGGLKLLGDRRGSGVERSKASLCRLHSAFAQTEFRDLGAAFHYERELSVQVAEGTLEAVQTDSSQNPDYLVLRVSENAFL